MKKKDIAIIISGLLFVVLICIDGFLIFEQNLEKTNSEQFFKHNIVSKEEYVGYTYDSVKQINYYINNGNKYIAFDKETGNKKFEIEIKEEDLANIEFTAEDIIKLYSYKIDDEYKLFNINGELVRTSNNIIMISNDWHNNKSYYVYENSLYDEDNKLIYKDLFKGVDTSVFSFRFNVYGSYVIYTDDTKGKLINLKTNEVIDIISYYKMNKYVEIEIKNNYYYLDTEKDELNKYTKYEDSDLGRILYQGSDKYLYLNSDIIKYEDKINYQGYQFDFTACNKGFKLAKDNKLLSDKCFISVYYDAYDNLYIIDDNNDMHYLVDGEIEERVKVGKYYVDSNTDELTIYNEKNEKVDHTCQNGFSYYKDNLYVCHDDDTGYLVDESFKLVTDKYDDIECNGSYCYVEKDRLYGLLYGNNVLIEPVYNNIQLFDKAIVAEDSYKIDYFLLGDGNYLNQEKLHSKVDDYNKIDIDKIITKYELDSIKEEIKIDQEFFKQYAYVVENSNGIGNYKRNILLGYQEVIANKEHLDKDYFLYRLKQLIIKDVYEMKEENTAGVYYNDKINIELLIPVNDSTINHEFTHFVDDCINREGSLTSIGVYRYLGDYISESEYEKLSSTEKKKVEALLGFDFNFLVEGGAEYNSSIYLNDMVSGTYPKQVMMYNMLSYLYGDDFVRNLFFGREGKYPLFKKFTQAGYTYDDIIKFNELTDRFHIDDNSDKETMYYIDMLIKLYEQEKDTKWYDDEVFAYFISSLLPSNLNKNSTTRYDEYAKVINNSFDNKVLDKISFKDYSYIYNRLYYKGKIYYSFYSFIVGSNGFEDDIKTYVYDIAKNEVKEY